jgi:glycosyltransferase involved in cell wall biosynthesis
MYNIESYIVKTLNSIINQTSIKGLEVIVVDDGSTDNSYVVAKEILENSGFFNYRIIRKENGGVSSARNAGLNSSIGDYVIFLDGDDIVSSNLVQTVKEKLINEMYDVIFWGCDYVNEDGTKIKEYFNQYSINDQVTLSGSEILKANLTNKIKICTGNIAIRKEILMKHTVNYTDGCANGEDQEFTQKLLCKIEKGIGIEASMTYYVLRKGSITQSSNIKRFDSIYALKRMFEYLETSSSYEIQVLAKDIQDEKIINNYLGNINNSLRHLKNRNSLDKNNIEELFGRINACYPDLDPILNNILRNESRLKLKTKIQITILKISKVLYSYSLIVTDFISK